MTTWIIEPHEPLIFRDGRPFGMQAGTQIRSLPFPFPSTIAGAVRSRVGTNESGLFDSTRIADMLKKIKIGGPLLVELSLTQTKHDTFTPLVPMPSDCLLLKNEKGDILKRLAPLQLQQGQFTDLQTLSDTLLPVGMQPHEEGKPISNPPQYWNWTDFENWLRNPQAMEGNIDLDDWERYEPQYEQRIHISMNARTKTAIPCQLFETSGIEFTVGGKDVQRLSGAKRIALAFDVDNQTSYPLLEGQGTLGSERRVVSWHESKMDLPKECPPDIVKEIYDKKYCRLILLTPACFKKGCIPETLFAEERSAKLIAMTNTRPQVVSGWNMQSIEPKESIRLAPAGTVFFIQLPEDDAKRSSWIEEHWMQCISDDPQWCNDGFGLAVLGTWDASELQLPQQEEEKI